MSVLPSRSSAAGGDDEPVGHHLGRTLGLHEGGDLFAQGVVALGGPVLQRGARLGRERSIGGGADAVHIKQRAVREATGEADDAGLAQQLEELADGGGLDVVEAIGEGRVERHGLRVRV
jgi:hypothetical protein